MDIAFLIVRLVLAGTFAIAALAKLSDQTGSRQALKTIGFPYSSAPAIAVAIPVIELAVAVALIPAATSRMAAVMALVLLALFSTVIAISLSRGRVPECRCFGRLSHGRISSGTFARNGVLAVLAVVTIAEPTPLSLASLNDYGDAEKAAHLAVALSILALASATGFAVLLLAQHGRILLRLDAVERSQPGAPGRAAAAVGLPRGSSAPIFVLPELDGGTISLDTLTTGVSRTLLVFSDTRCGDCVSLLAHVAAWQHAALRVAVIASGPKQEIVNERRVYALRTVLLDEHGDITGRYRILNVPAAVLIGGDGEISSETAYGIDAVALLAVRALNPTSDPPLAIGQLAPVLAMPTLDGGSVSLELTSVTTLLVFWDPQCAACVDPLTELRAWAEETHARFRLLIISRGSTEVNRAMGIKVQIMLDAADSWAHMFGARGTPSGVIVDARGVIASPVASGMEAVRELRKQALSPDQDDVTRTSPANEPAGITRQQVSKLREAPTS